MTRLAARTATSQRGFALLAALFLLVALAALGAVAVRVSGVQQHTVSLSLQSARAFQAAQSGIDFAAYQALLAGSCVSSSVALTESGLSGFTVDVSCTRTSHGEGGGITNVYALEAFARFGAYGGPDYVSRRVRATVTDSS